MGHSCLQPSTSSNVYYYVDYTMISTKRTMPTNCHHGAQARVQEVKELRGNVVSCYTQRGQGH